MFVRTLSGRRLSRTLRRIRRRGRGKIVWRHALVSCLLNTHLVLRVTIVRFTRGMSLLSGVRRVTLVTRRVSSLKLLILMLLRNRVKTLGWLRWSRWFFIVKCLKRVALSVKFMKKLLLRRKPCLKWRTIVLSSARKLPALNLRTIRSRR